jgi:hypothetical protein
MGKEPAGLVGCPAEQSLAANTERRPAKCRVQRNRRSIEVDIQRGPGDGLILGLSESLLKLPFEELRLNSFLLRTLAEVSLSFGGLPPKELAGAI